MLQIVEKSILDIEIFRAPLDSIDTYKSEKTMSRTKLCVLQPKLRVLLPSLHALRQIWHLGRQKFACPKASLFFGIYNGENKLFSKSV